MSSRVVKMRSGVVKKGSRVVKMRSGVVKGDFFEKNKNPRIPLTNHS